MCGVDIHSEKGMIIYSQRNNKKIDVELHHLFFLGNVFD